ncbi:MAG: FAD-binding oxidoreductase [Gemmatimonadales bacterium]
MNAAIFDVLAAEFGESVTRSRTGEPRVAPPSLNALAAALGLAHRHGWRVRIEGRGTWMPPDAPADLAVTTGRLDTLVSIAPADLVATAQTGIQWQRLRARLAEHRTRVAIDPPGSSDRSLGSVLATATSGSLAHRFGPVRDHILGTTVATGDGRLVRSGGVVVKNVAGFDLTKLAVGGFGGFGVIAEVNLRLRSLPAAQRLLTARASLDDLFHAGRDLVAADVDAAAVELVSPDGGQHWHLLVTLSGTRDGVAAEAARAATLGASVGLAAIEGDAFAGVAEGSLDGPVAIRAGALPPSFPDTVELILARLGPGTIGGGLGRGGLRWCGTTSADALLELRRELAAREIPLTLERAPWPIRSAVGHFGAYREGLQGLSDRLRQVFDPDRILVTPLEGSAGG